MASDGAAIRRMDEGDLSGVNQISHLLFGKERVSTWPQAVETHWKEHPPTLNFVAEQDGQVVGFLLGGDKTGETHGAPSRVDRYHGHSS
ncbi:hypothetical protein ES703_104579 [subsurface metagenome]